MQCLDVEAGRLSPALVERYLELKERGLLLENAPHLVRNLGFVVPNYDWWEAPFYGLGLKLYNLLAGKYGFGSSRILSREETLQRLPTISTDVCSG